MSGATKNPTPVAQGARLDWRKSQEAQQIGILGLTERTSAGEERGRKDLQSRLMGIKIRTRKDGNTELLWLPSLLQDILPARSFLCRMARAEKGRVMGSKLTFYTSPGSRRLLLPFPRCRSATALGAFSPPLLRRKAARVGCLFGNKSHRVRPPSP